VQHGDQVGDSVWNTGASGSAGASGRGSSGAAWRSRGLPLEEGGSSQGRGGRLHSNWIREATVRDAVGSRCTSANPWIAAVGEGAEARCSTPEAPVTLTEFTRDALREGRPF
jgi:hypothetical protein